jgi:hypothetical protein
VSSPVTLRFQNGRRSPVQQLIPQPGSIPGIQIEQIAQTTQPFFTVISTFSQPILYIRSEALSNLRFYGENCELVPNAKNGEHVSLGWIASAPGQVSAAFEPGIDELGTPIFISTVQNPSH